MIKYMALSVVALALLSIGVAHAQTAEQGAALNQRDLRTLDSSLASKVEEQMRFIDLLERHLRGSDQVPSGTDADAVLSQRKYIAPAPAPAQPTPIAAPVVASVPERRAPWWEAYRVDMIMHSPGDSVAVVNERLVRPGDMLEPGVEVAAIREDRVLVYRGNRRVELIYKGR